MNNFEGRKLGYLAALTNAVIIGFSFLFTKMALEHASPIDTLTFRFAISFAVLSVPVAFGRVKLNYRGKPIGKAMLLAAMYPLGFFTLQAYGLQNATSAEGGIIYAFTPVLTMILASLFLNEKTTVLQKLSILLSVFGVVLIFIMKESSIDLSSLSGIVLLFLSCLAFAGYSVLARSLMKAYSPMELSYLLLAGGFAAFLVVSFSTHMTAGTLDRFYTPLMSGTFILSVLYLGVLSSLVTSITANFALSKLEASQVSVFSNLATVVSIAAGAVFLQEDITVYSIIGSALIIAGVIGANSLGRPQAATFPEGSDRSLKG